MAIIAIVLFVLYAFGVHLGTVNLLGLGLAFLAAALVVPWTPWKNSRV
jgi:hypothetical protein